MGGVAGAALLQAQWPAIVAAAQHAHQAAKSTHPAHFEVLTPEQAKEVEAICSRIIPTDETPGAHEAGVVFFIDQALKTFSADSKPQYDAGIPALNELMAKLYPGAKKFSAGTPEQQDKVLMEFTATDNRGASPRYNINPTAAGFFETIRFHTIAGYLVDPSGGGNRDYVGWKAIGREPSFSFSPPFGFYDKDYPGFVPYTKDSEKS
jgi:gluconate 2-dehydrogenase gamma chain